jgi:hypothetical protein
MGTDAQRHRRVGVTEKAGDGADVVTLTDRHGGRPVAEIMQPPPGVDAGDPPRSQHTHIHRLAARWGLSDGSNVARTERDLKAVFPQETWNARHLQITFFGREYCPARRHDFAACPICSSPPAKRGGETSEVTRDGGVDRVPRARAQPSWNSAGSGSGDRGTSWHTNAAMQISGRR